MWTFDPHQREQLYNSKLNIYKRIKSTDCQVLKLLVKHQGELVSKDVLYNNAWEDRVVSDPSLTQAIAQLRLTLGDSGKEQKIIKTLPRKGYMLIGGHVTFSDSYEEKTQSIINTSSIFDDDKIISDNQREVKLSQKPQFFYYLRLWRKVNIFLY